MLVALSCALLWNVVLLNQKVACDVAAGRIKADAELTIKCVAPATPGAPAHATLQHAEIAERPPEDCCHRRRLRALSRVRTAVVDCLCSPLIAAL